MPRGLDNDGILKILFEDDDALGDDSSDDGDCDFTLGSSVSENTDEVESSDRELKNSPENVYVAWHLVLPLLQVQISLLYSMYGPLLLGM